MQINWIVRIKNPIFWVQIAAAIIIPIITYFGLNLEDLTSWASLGNLLLQAISNPFVVGTVLFSVWGAINDPTTTGISDSDQAMTYSEPK